MDYTAIPAPWRALVSELNGGRIPDGEPGIRDVDAPCSDFTPGEPGGGRCSTDGAARKPNEDFLSESDLEVLQVTYNAYGHYPYFRLMDQQPTLDKEPTVDEARKNLEEAIMSAAPQIPQTHVKGIGSIQNAIDALIEAAQRASP